METVAALSLSVREALAAVVAGRGIESVLLISSRLHGFAGVQMIQADLAATFQACGASVTVAALQVTPSFVSAMGCFGEVIELDTEPQSLLGRRFDLVIAHNWLAWGTALLECRVAFRHLLLCSYSSVDSTETLWGITEAADALLFHAEIGLLRQADSLPKDGPRRYTTRNPLSLEWFSEPRPERAGVLRRLAVVSNHATPELLAVCKALPERGIACDLIGSLGKPERMSPAVLDRYDAVVTIGHTVQKALARGVPVYCYDRWGGPGWVRPDTFDVAERANFTGLESRRRISSDAMMTELIDGFSQAQAVAESLRVVAAERYSLDRTFAAILDDLPPGNSYRDLSGNRWTSVRRVLRHSLNARFRGDPFPPEFVLDDPDLPPRVRAITWQSLDSERIARFQTLGPPAFRFLATMAPTTTVTAQIALRAPDAPSHLSIRVDGRDAQIVEAVRGSKNGVDARFVFDIDISNATRRYHVDLVTQSGDVIEAATIDIA